MPNLKIKVSKNDAIIFGIFCAVLFYLIDISVLNVLKLLREEFESFSLNPFAIFFEGSDYVLLTLFIFAIVIIVIITSVKSSIFSSEKGFGFEIGEKKEHGYSRWLKEKEMKVAYKIHKVGVLDETADYAGVVFINDGKNMWVDDSENHTLVIGVTGSGKTSAVVDPLIYSLCKHKESMVITDPKGEIFKDHSELLKARGYKIIVLNFRNPDMGNSWNPLSLPYQLYKSGNVDKSQELLEDVASNILKGDSSQDPFWENSSADYFAGCTLGLFEDAKEEEVNINSIFLMTTAGEDKFGAGSTFIKEYFTMKGENSKPYTFASGTIGAPNETKGSILSVFRQKIRLFASRDQLSEMLARSDFNMRDIGTEPTAVFIIIHDEKTTYHALATIFIKQCYETLIDVAQSNGGKLPCRTNFILDEFANMPALKDVTTMVTAARSRQIRFTFIIQNFAQLNEVYGEHDAQTIRSNCQNLIYLLTSEVSALEEISKLCGEVKSKDDEKTASTPLVTVADLQKLEMNEVIIIRNRLNPFKTKLKQAYTIDWGDKGFDKGVLKKREKNEVAVFDIKEFVKLRKKSSMSSNGSPGGAALGGGFAGLSGGSSNNFSNFGGGAGGGSFGSNLFNDPISNGNKIPTYEDWKKEKEKNSNNGAAIAFNPLRTPFGDTPRPVDNKPKPSFDLDDLIKRIDAKIEEIEAEEKINENKEKASVPASPNISNIPASPVSSVSTPSSKPSITLPSSLLNDKKEVNVVPMDEDIVKISDNGNENVKKDLEIVEAIKEDTAADDLDDILEAPNITPKVVMSIPKDNLGGVKYIENLAADKKQEEPKFEVIDEKDTEFDFIDDDSDELNKANDLNEVNTSKNDDISMFNPLNTNTSLIDKIDISKLENDINNKINKEEEIEEKLTDPAQVMSDSDSLLSNLDYIINSSNNISNNTSSNNTNGYGSIFDDNKNLDNYSMNSFAGVSPVGTKPLRGIVDPTKSFGIENNAANISNRVSSGLSKASSLDHDVDLPPFEPKPFDDRSSSLIDSRLNKTIRGSVVGNDVNNPSTTNLFDDIYDD